MCDLQGGCALPGRPNQFFGCEVGVHTNCVLLEKLELP